MKSQHRERGAVALETALVLPLLLIILVGMMEFGRAFNVQISLTHSAREGARYAAINYNDPPLMVEATALAASPSLSNLTVAVNHNAGACAPGTDVEVTTEVVLASMTGLLEAQFLDLPPLFPLTLTGVGVMRCGG